MSKQAVVATCCNTMQHGLFQTAEMSGAARATRWRKNSWSIKVYAAYTILYHPNQNKEVKHRFKPKHPKHFSNFWSFEGVCVESCNLSSSRPTRRPCWEQTPLDQSLDHCFVVFLHHGACAFSHWSYWSPCSVLLRWLSNLQVLPC